MQTSIDGLSDMLQALSPVMRVRALSLGDIHFNCFFMYDRCDQKAIKYLEGDFDT